MFRRLQELQCKHEEEMRVLQDKFDKTVQHYEEEIQKVQHLSTRRVFSTADGLSPQISRSNSVESLSCDPLLRSDSLPHGNSEFTYMFGKNEKELLSLVSMKRSVTPSYMQNPRGLSVVPNVKPQMFDVCVRLDKSYLKKSSKCHETSVQMKTARIL